MTSLNKTLSVLALVSCALCAVSFLPFVREKSAPKAFQSALLNPAHRDAVTEIVISTVARDEDGQAMDRAIALRKSVSTNGTEVWSVSDGLTTVRADEKLVKNLLENTIKIRKMYTVSDNKEKIQFSHAVSSSLVLKNDNTLYTKIDFFGSNSLTNRLMLAVENASALYETHDDLSQFLQPTVRYWAKPELVQTIDAPVSFVWEENPRVSAKNQPHTVPFSQKSARIDQNAADFAQISHDIMALRHGALLPATMAQQQELGFADTAIADRGENRVHTTPTERTAVLTVSDGAGNTEAIAFFPQDDGACRCEYRINGQAVSAANARAGTADGKAEAAVGTPAAPLWENAPDGLQFAFEISGWTYERLQALFSDR